MKLQGGEMIFVKGHRVGKWNSQDFKTWVFFFNCKCSTLFYYTMSTYWLRFILSIQQVLRVMGKGIFSSGAQRTKKISRELSRWPGNFVILSGSRNSRVRLYRSVVFSQRFDAIPYFLSGREGNSRYELDSGYHEKKGQDQGWFDSGTDPLSHFWPPFSFLSLVWHLQKNLEV